MKRQSIEKRVSGIIASRRVQLNKEIAEQEAKLRSTMSYYGCGSPYRQQEEALERRRRELKDLENYGQRAYRIRPHHRARMYVMYCNNCGSVSMTSREPAEGWHECPSCRAMMYTDKTKAKEFNIEDEGQNWLEILKECEE